jgi:hypothetical protein
MGTERKTRSGSQTPGIRNGFRTRYFLATSQRVLKRGKRSDKRPFHGQRKSSRTPPTLSDIVWCWASRSIDMPTATADMATETGLAERLVETAKAFRLGYRPELLCEPLRAARGGLGIEKPTRYHAVVGSSRDPWLRTISRHLNHKTVTRRASFECRIVARRGTGGADFRVRCRLSVPPRGLGDSLSTVWYRVSLPMLKDPHTGRPDAWGGSGTCSPGSPLRGRASERGIGFSMKRSAERLHSWIGRRS